MLPLTLHTDAIDNGYGGVLDIFGISHYAHGVFDKSESAAHFTSSTLRELLGVKYVL